MEAALSDYLELLTVVVRRLLKLHLVWLNLDGCDSWRSSYDSVAGLARLSALASTFCREVLVTFYVHPS